MTDITERLRLSCFHDLGMCKEAAVEIERLRAWRTDAQWKLQTVYELLADIDDRGVLGAFDDCADLAQRVNEILGRVLNDY